VDKNEFVGGVEVSVGFIKRVKLENLSPEVQTLITLGESEKKYRDIIDTLTEAYQHFRMKEGGALSFMVVAGMYLAPRKLTEMEIERGKILVSELEKEGL
jgi:hypothetical protein